MRFLHFTETMNIGDTMCCPLWYFPDVFAGAEEAHIRTAQLGESAIVGGGGIFTGEFTQAICRLGPSIVWGAGTNEHGATERIYPYCIKDWSLVGIRDIGSGFDWVPCVSCMAHEFDSPSEPTSDHVVYGHREEPIALASPRMMINHGDDKSFAKAVAFLASGALVKTNSYHGAYWALLLGRNVELIEPFSNRFFYLPARYDGNILTPEPGLLERCRDANRQFANRVHDWVISQ